MEQGHKIKDDGKVEQLKFYASRISSPKMYKSFDNLKSKCR